MISNILKNLLIILICFQSSQIYAATYSGSTTAPVVIAGAIIKSKHIDQNKKYKRKDCPVCKGKGWYLSGDGIAKVDCGYCELEKTQSPQKVITHPPITIKQNCPDGSCNKLNK